MLRLATYYKWFMMIDTVIESYDEPIHRTSYYSWLFAMELYDTAFYGLKSTH